MTAPDPPGCDRQAVDDGGGPGESDADGGSGTDRGGADLDRRALLKGVTASVAATSLAGCSTSSLPVVGCGPGGGDTRTVSGNVSGTWGTDCGTIAVSGETFVPDGATLTVAPGTEVVFEEGAELGIAESADFVADGDSDARIYFRGDEKTPGYWSGIVKDGRGNTSPGGRFVLNHVTLEYAGGNNFQQVRNGDGYHGAALVFKGPTELTMTETRIEECRGYGVYFPPTAMLAQQFQGNRITNCERVARASQQSAHVLGDAGNYTGNGEDMIDIYPEGEGPLSVDGTWNATGVDYRVWDDIEVDGHLTIGRGKTVRFRDQARLTVAGNGALTADGGQVDATRITFTGDESNSRPWWGIRFEGSTSQDNRLQNVVVEGAGIQGDSPGYPANVTLADGAAASITGSTLREGVDYGIAVKRGSRLRSFEENVVTGNAVPAWVRERSAAELGPTTSYTGNEDDRIHVEAQSIEAGEAATWSALDVPYLVQRKAFGNRTEVRGTLAVDPGAVVEFAEDRGFAVLDDGALRAVGEDDARIHFRGGEAEAGHWRGIEFVGTGNEDNRLERVTVEHGGASTNPPFGAGEYYQPANVLTRDGAFVDLIDVVARNSAGYGVSLWAPFEGTFARNALTGNEKGAAFAHARAVDILDAASTYEGNGRDRVVVRGQEITDDATWNALDADFLLLRHPQSAKTVVTGSLNIERGTTVYFQSTAGFQVAEGGSLTAEGTQTNKIEMRQARGDDGDGWLGIVTTGSGSNVSLEWVDLSGSFQKDRTEVDPRTAVVLGVMNESSMEARKISIESSLPSDDGWDVWIECDVQTQIRPRDGVSHNSCPKYKLEHQAHPNNCPAAKSQNPILYHKDLGDDPIEDDDR